MNYRRFEIKCEYLGQPITASLDLQKIGVSEEEADSMTEEELMNKVRDYIRQQTPTNLEMWAT